MPRVAWIVLFLSAAVASLFLLWTSTDPAPSVPRQVTPTRTPSAAFETPLRPPLDATLREASESVPIDVHATAVEAAHESWRGVVVDADGRPLAGARIGRLPAPRTVRFVSHGPPSRNPALFAKALWSESGVDGTFELACAEPADNTDWALLVRHPGSVSTLLACTGPLAGGGDCGTIRLAPGCIVRGRVLNSDGSPAAGADVDGRLEPFDATLVEGLSTSSGWRIVGLRDGLLHATTDDQGAFVLGGLPAASLELVVEHLGHATLRTEPRSLVPGTQLDVGDLRLPRGGTIAGRVVDDRDRPVAGAELRALVDGSELLVIHDHGVHFALAAARTGPWGIGSQHEARACVTTSDADGRFELAGMNSAACTVLASASGFEPEAERDVPAGSRDLVLRLVPLGTLTLRVVDDASGQPLPDAELQVVRIADASHEAHPSDTLPVDGLESDDSLPVERLAPDEFLVRDVCDAPLVAIVRSPAVGHFALRVAGHGPGEATRELRVPRAASLEGRVVDSGNQPFAGVRVSFSPWPNEAQAARFEPVVVATDAAGRFGSGPLPAGDWVVSAQAEDFVRASTRLDVAPGQAVVLEDLVLLRTATVEARLVDATGAPLPGVPLVLVATDPPADGRSNLAAGTTSAHGSTRLAAPPVGVRLQSREPPIQVELGTLAEGETRTVLVQPLVSGVFSGSVRDEAGAVAGAHVDFTHALGNASTVTDDAGRWTLVVPGGLEGRLAFRSPRGGVAARTLQVAAGGSLVVDITLGSGRLHGRVLASGVPAPDATVQAWRPDGAPLGRSVRTDGDGRFELGHLEDGPWVLQASGSMLSASALVEASLPNDASRDIVLDVTRLRTVTGTVRLAGGQPANDDCVVYLLSADENPWPDAAFPEDDGSFRFERVPPGDHELLVTRGLRTHERPMSRDWAEKVAWLRLAVRVGEDTDLHQDLILPPGRP